MQKKREKYFMSTYNTTTRTILNTIITLWSKPKVKMLMNSVNCERTGQRGKQEAYSLHYSLYNLVFRKDNSEVKSVWQVKSTLWYTCTNALQALALLAYTHLSTYRLQAPVLMKHSNGEQQKRRRKSNIK